MNKYILLYILVFTVSTSFSQKQIPNFSEKGLMGSVSAAQIADSDYKLLVYGAVNCSYSKYLIENLNAFDDCDALEIVILLNDSKNKIESEYPELIKKYRVYSNDILQYQLDKKNDLFPQTFLFKENEQLLSVKGIKKNMFVKINNEVQCKSAK